MRGRERVFVNWIVTSPALEKECLFNSSNDRLETRISFNNILFSSVSMAVTTFGVNFHHTPLFIGKISTRL